MIRLSSVIFSWRCWECHHQDTADHADTGQANASSGGLNEQQTGRKCDREQDGRRAFRSPKMQMPFVKERETINCGGQCVAQSGGCPTNHFARAK
jgi:hypothetical protein